MHVQVVPGSYIDNLAVNPRHDKIQEEKFHLIFCCEIRLLQRLLEIPEGWDGPMYVFSFCKG